MKFCRDDGIVVVVVGGRTQVAHHVTLAGYLSTEETTRPRELAYGVLREPASPSWGHQIVVGRVYERLDRHARRTGAGIVVTSPIDVILDRERHLVVQPDLVFVRADRRDICTDRVWGAPDLAIEVLSVGNSRHDRTIKVDWYRRYRVAECWLVDMIAKTVEVIDLAAGPDVRRTFEDRACIRSAVLPRLRVRPADFFSG